MDPPPHSQHAIIGRLRPYLRFLAENEVNRILQPKLDPSDVVQEALLRAYRAIDQLEGRTEAQIARWLRRVLATTMANLRRDFHRAKRDVRRERRLEASLEESAIRLKPLLADNPSPSRAAENYERAALVVSVLAALPADQRQAITLRHLEGHTLAEIAAKMQRSEDSVCRLLRRAVGRLRKQLDSVKP